MKNNPNDAAAVISQLTAGAARTLAVEILLADPEWLADDILESCLYLLRERLREESAPAMLLGWVPAAGSCGAKAGDTVLMSAEDYDAWQETSCLLRSPANARRLMEAVARDKAGTGTGSSTAPTTRK